MSVNYSIYCRDHKLALWIGQGVGTLYTDEEETMEALRKFLFSHIGCDLRFDTDDKTMLEFCNEIIPEKDGSLEINSPKNKSIKVGQDFWENQEEHLKKLIEE